MLDKAWQAHAFPVAFTCRATCRTALHKPSITPSHRPHTAPPLQPTSHPHTLAPSHPTHSLPHCPTPPDPPSPRNLSPATEMSAPLRTRSMPPRYGPYLERGTKRYGGIPKVRQLSEGRGTAGGGDAGQVFVAVQRCWLGCWRTHWADGHACTQPHAPPPPPCTPLQPFQPNFPPPSPPSALHLTCTCPSPRSLLNLPPHACTHAHMHPPTCPAPAATPLPLHSSMPLLLIPPPATPTTHPPTEQRRGAACPCRA